MLIHISQYVWVDWQQVKTDIKANLGLFKPLSTKNKHPPVLFCLSKLRNSTKKHKKSLNWRQYTTFFSWEDLNVWNLLSFITVFGASFTLSYFLFFSMSHLMHLFCVTCIKIPTPKHFFVLIYFIFLVFYPLIFGVFL